MKFNATRWALLMLVACTASVSGLHANTSNDTPSKSVDPISSGPRAADTELPWSQNYADALKKAVAEHKPVLLDFTGSDWCVWCHRLHDEVFVQAAFRNYARENLILVEIDFPRQHRLSAELTKQNAELSAQFKIEGYPTIVLVDANGRELGRTGYIEGGAKTFVRELKRFARTANSVLARPAPQQSTSGQ